MAANRPRRSNAGNLMAELLDERENAAKEGDDVYENLWGGFLDVENDRDFKLTEAEDRSDDSNSELDEQESDEETFERRYANVDSVEEDFDEPKRKKKKPLKSWLLSKISETNVDENKLTEADQKVRMKECSKVAEFNRKTLAELKKRQLEDQEKQSKNKRAKHLEGSKEVWYSDANTTYMLLPDFKTWAKPKVPKIVKKRNSY